ncbi:MAG: ketopantoate reductase family protein [Syntrophomonas sp.]
MMNTIERVSLIGLGALGSAYFSQIRKFLPQDNISIIAEGARAEKYRTGGVKVNGRDYRLKVVEPFEKCDPADLLVFGVKFYNLNEAVRQVKNHVSDNTIIISLLNGISSEEIIGNAYGLDKVLYSISVGIDAVREGTATSYKNLGMISFGQKINLSGQYTPKVLKLKEFLERTQINYSIPEDMLKVLWWKFMVNVGVNQVSAVLRAPYGVFQKVKKARELMIASMQEVIDIAQVAGIKLTRTAIDEWLEVVDKLSPAGKTSMLQDIEAGRPTEVDIFAGTVVELGQKYKVPTPINKTLLDIIKACEGMFQYNEA